MRKHVAENGEACSHIHFIVERGLNSIISNPLYFIFPEAVTLDFAPMYFPDAESSRLCRYIA